ncbi:MAG: hypothetical protein AAGB93_00540 [Planctomycetota bacterium]
MTELHYPVLLEVTAGTPGQPDARGTLRRTLPNELVFAARELLSWMPAHTVLVRNGQVLTALQMQPGTVVGRTLAGATSPLGRTDLEAILDLVARLGEKADTEHVHTIAQITGLTTVLEGVSRNGHDHPFSDIRDIDFATLAEGRVLGFQGGQFRFLNQLGGGGGLGNPLSADLDLGGNALVDGPVSLLRRAGSRVQLGGRLLPVFAESAPDDGEVWVFEVDQFVHRRLSAAEVNLAAIAGLTADDVQEAIAALKAITDDRALTDHSHALTDLQAGVSATPGFYLTPTAGGGVEWKVLPAASGGVANPLTANLDLAEFALMSGLTEVLRVQGGQIFLGTRRVFDANIESPAQGHVAIYDAGAGEFRNRLLRPEEVSTSGGELLSTTLATLRTDVDAATLQSTDDLPEGAANRYATAGSVQAAGAVMASLVPDDDALGNSALPPSQRSVKTYLDTEIAAVGGGGIPSGTTFPVSPTGGQVFRRTDLRETFQYDGTLLRWEGEPSSFVERNDRSAIGLGAGSYVFGGGSLTGVSFPWDVVVTAISVRSSVSDTGEVQLRIGTSGGPIVIARTLAFSASSAETDSAVDYVFPAGSILSMYARNFSGGLATVHALIHYRRAIAA